MRLYKITNPMKLLILCLLGVATLNLDTSAKMVDIIYLNNGSTVEGVTLEIGSDETIKIKVDNGSIFTYPMSSVEKVMRKKYINPMSSAMISGLGGSIWLVAANIERPDYQNGGSMFAVVTHTIQLLSFFLGQSYANLATYNHWSDKNMNITNRNKILAMATSVIASNLLVERSYSVDSRVMFGTGILVGLSTHAWLGINAYETIQENNRQIYQTSSVKFGYIPYQGLVTSYNFKF